ncbi:GspE/PulE family protein [Niveibacterium umoris]|uniref:General secretion pathway protein E n=1 Tax=Niveibacterium umoris TaxID=1193620 RepID=A0A840BIQ8_9RHOO|nr:GspE/PulE family protein [Niveibacterium umoris]MBB4010806.1 general secretion pathway protein E [Niveibacterium umoris]
MTSALTLDLVQRLRSENAGNTVVLPQLIQDALGIGPISYLHEVSRLFGIKSAHLPELEHMTPRFDLLPFAECYERNCLVMDDPKDVLHQMAANMPVVVLTDPFSAEMRNWIANRLHRRHLVAIAHPDDMRVFLAKHERKHRAMDQVEVGDDSVGVDEGSTTISLASLAGDTRPVVKLVNSTLYDALKNKASDIHFESTVTGIQIKYRIDGVLLAGGQAGGVQIAEQVISRLKVLAELDISERRIPQDGRFKVVISGREVDFRVSIMPSIHGEDAVLRVLDKQGADDAWKTLRLDILGLDTDTIAQIRSLAAEPYGLLLVTGPTGSGKSTTLYATLSEINSGEEKIITIEDPVEYQLPGILQIPVNDKKGLTFARGLRSILRHDPDKILVGEIRDAETATIAIQAAQTGHLVFASVHANNAFSVMDRFMNMGIDRHSFTDALIGVVAQRLIRRVCPHCVQTDAPSEEMLRANGIPPERVANWRFRKGKGCEQCRGTGYLGRKAIAEVLRTNDEIRQVLSSNRPIGDLRAAAARAGFAPLRRIAMRSVARGETTLEEINRVTVVG